MKIVCDSCKRDMRPVLIGVVALDLMGHTPGRAYKQYETDRYACPECGKTILINPFTAGKHMDSDGLAELRSRVSRGDVEVVLVFETRNQKEDARPLEYYLKE